MNCASQLGRGIVTLLVSALSLAMPTGAAARDDDDPPGFEDPTERTLPRTHRFRLGVEFVYMRLTQAIDTAGNTQRFHLLPIGLDVAYQAQFLGRVMARPSISLAANPANTFASMPVLIHPKLHFGYQGTLLGVAIGYGYLMPLRYQANAIDSVRGGLGAPIILHNHHIDAEISLTSRLDRGALSFIARVGANNGRVWHFDIQGERSWRPIVTLNVGWYFGAPRSRRRPRRAPPET